VPTHKIQRLTELDKRHFRIGAKVIFSQSKAGRKRPDRPGVVMGYTTSRIAVKMEGAENLAHVKPNNLRLRGDSN
jgi:hypothetical protein